MILLADGGSTKVDWCLIDKSGLVKQVFTKGANPFFRTKEEISEDIKENLMPKISEFEIKEVYFFGSGCAFPEKNDIIKYAVLDNIPDATVHVASDLLGAAIGLCGKKSGIACIIGTGSNSCYFDGNNIIDNVSPLGYILGDEGSGAVLGKLFIGNCLKNQFTNEIKSELLKYLNQTQADIIENVYRKPLPNRYLASVSPFIKKNLDNPKVYKLVHDSFMDFFIKNVMQYDYKNLKISLTGSIAFHYQDVIYKIGKELDLKIDKITASPMEGLINYYVNKK